MTCTLRRLCRWPDTVWTCSFVALVALVVFTSPIGLDRFTGLLAIVVILGGVDEEDCRARAEQLSTWVLRALCIAAADGLLCRQAHLGFGSWEQSLLVLLSFAAADGGVVRVSSRVSDNTTFAGGSALLVTTGWLTLPLWLPWERLSGTVIRLLVDVHPVFAMNTAVRSLGVWTEQPVPYALGRLGQDVPYALPTTIWPMTGAHVAAAGLGFAVAAVGRRRRSTAGRDRLRCASA